MIPLQDRGGKGVPINSFCETEELMQSINGLHNFYYLPELHDMRCKTLHIYDIICGRYHRNLLNSDVYMFTSKEQPVLRECERDTELRNL